VFRRHEQRPAVPNGGHLTAGVPRYGNGVRGARPTDGAESVRRRNLLPLFRRRGSMFRGSG
jgi:hypothetical protein